MFSDFSSDEHTQAFAEFLAYKTRVPVRGAILLNEKMDEVVLVKGWKKGANWSFPRGKINKDEPDLDCAVREVYEETGYDLKVAGLVPNDEEVESFEMDLREQNMKLFVFRGVPMDTDFEPRTRKEISNIQWWKLSDLPTLKKKKQQQEGQGGDLALNANKFYMVAPFLPRLKKFIASQKKLDKARKASVVAPVPTAEAEKPVTVADHHDTEERTAATSTGEMAKLLDGLRQSAEPIRTAELSEDTATGPEPITIASQLKDFLGVPSSSIKADEGSPAAKSASNPNADSLLALLQSKPALPVQIPHTPMEQVIEKPRTPASPQHPQHQPQRFPIPPPPDFPTRDLMATAQEQQPRPPQTRLIPPPQQPAQLVPRNVTSQYTKPVPRNAVPPTVAPYQRTGDPQFVQDTQTSGSQPSSVPRAINFPPPKLNPQSSALLNLFKTGSSTKNVRVEPDVEAPNKSVHPGGSLKSEQFQAPTESKDEMRISDVVDSRQAFKPTDQLILPRLGPTTHSPKAGDTGKQDLEHNNKLLNLFRNPPTTPATTSKPTSINLQLPSTPVELSALPTTPSHSREPSRTTKPTHGLAPSPSRNGSAKIERRPRKSTTKSQKPPVSATVNGPLNVPQFEVVAKASKNTKQDDPRQNQAITPKPSPVKILARPTNSQGVSSAAESPAVAKQQKCKAPSLDSLVTPVKELPPKPDLKAHEVPPKPFNPQILRRPAHMADSGEPSPIQPLPSPKHNVFADRRSEQPTDHRKSLLSLFTKPSPAVSPPSATPASAIDPSALVSPLTGLPPSDAMFARLAQPARPLPQEPKPIPGPTQIPMAQVPMARMGSAGNIFNEGMKSGRSSGKQTPTSKTTPEDRTFLLGYLNKVLESGK